ncbi:hypothetical protein BN1708_009559, partial [Verticillium longisporum]
CYCRRLILRRLTKTACSPAHFSKAVAHTRLTASHTDDLRLSTPIPSPSSSTAHPITITIAIVISSPSLATKARIRSLIHQPAGKTDTAS